MYCNICASDYEFINFLNTFIAENGLSVYDPINKLWLRRIDEKVNAKSSFIYNIAVYKMEDTTKIPVRFERFLSENLNVNPNSVLNSYFWSTSLDRDKKYYSSGNGVNQITPF